MCTYPTEEIVCCSLTTLSERPWRTSSEQTSEYSLLFFSLLSFPVVYQHPLHFTISSFHHKMFQSNWHGKLRTSPMQDTEFKCVALKKGLSGNWWIRRKVSVLCSKAHLFTIFLGHTTTLSSIRFCLWCLQRYPTFDCPSTGRVIEGNILAGLAPVMSFT